MTYPKKKQVDPAMGQHNPKYGNSFTFRIKMADFDPTVEDASDSDDEAYMYATFTIEPIEGIAKAKGFLKQIFNCIISYLCGCCHDKAVMTIHEYNKEKAKVVDSRKIPWLPKICFCATYVPYLLNIFSTSTLSFIVCAVFGFWYLFYMVDIRRRLGYMAQMFMLIAFNIGIVMMICTFYVTQWLKVGQYKMYWNSESNTMDQYGSNFG